ncbi:hypothetical protein [Actinopolymorpha rutila]|uniref:Uncharacterized protein n=1 Tax=Actinopolymorpha rutila TaxID=446787 RepID=A0A852ZTR6_9ACTN|nr:hypothetical protein [Actinopolymorpha rutila]NYH92390.1 hypothetical protein [Actinopolymorpha rutila]
MVLPPDALAAPSEEPMTVRVSIQDVTMADESSATVAKAVVEAHDRTDVEGPYLLEADLTPGRQYAVYAHVDRSGDGTTAPGDFINTVRVPLPADSVGNGVHVEIPVRQID